MPSLAVRELFPGEISLLTADVLNKIARNPAKAQHEKKIKEIIDELGIQSAISQNLKHPITTYEKLLESNHKFYLAVNHEDDDEDGVIIGFLKVGEKRLFVTDGSEPAKPANIQCVLDFFINANYQRHGWGKHIFEYALHNDNIEPQNMAYDRPSEKLISFLAKHYQLKDVVEQPNRYVMYRDYFNNNSIKYSQGRCIP